MRFLLLHFTNCANLIAHLALARAQTVLQIVIFFLVLITRFCSLCVDIPCIYLLHAENKRDFSLFTHGRAGEEPGNEVGLELYSEQYSELNIFTS